MTTSKLFIYISLVSILWISNHPLVKSANGNGNDFTFTTKLIHKDSPSYNPSLSHFQRIANALKRSSTQSRLRFKAAAAESDLIYAVGDYVMEFSVGTPPVPSLAIADTGSDLIWTQCQPCIRCFNQTLPIFKPKASRTYKKIPCNTARCNSLQETFCNKRKFCLYSDLYGDRSYTYGELATETFTLHTSAGKKTKTVSIPNITFGCGFKNGGIFSGTESGIVGLGGGKASLVRQLGRGKFSYCLNSLSSSSNSSMLMLGSIPKVQGKRGVSTPLFRKFPETFYYLTLKGISVGKKFLSDSGHRGNMIIDSGTSVTLLPTKLYYKVEKAVKRSVKLKRINDPVGALGLCFYTRKDIRKIPKIVVHFKGAKVKLGYDNIFVRTSEFAVCLAARPTEELAIYGNIAQMNFLVGYDLNKRTVSFKPTDCGKL